MHEITKTKQENEFLSDKKLKRTKNSVEKLNFDKQTKIRDI